MANPISSQTRSIYRSILRDLPRHSQRSVSTPSPLKSRIKEYLAESPGTEAGAKAAPAGRARDTEAVRRARLEEAQQFTKYVRAQGVYNVLLERYNPGSEMDEEERVRLTARRVGMDLPATAEENTVGDEGEGGNNGNGNGNR